MPSEIRLTKIVATLGPATESPEQLQALLDAGCNVFRFNAAHSDAAWRQMILDRLGTLCGDAMRQPVAVMLDLCGPKVRVHTLSADPLDLATGSSVTILRGDPPGGAGPAFSTTYPALIDECRPGERILLDDGAISLTVREAGPDGLQCDVRLGGVLHARKGINLPDTEVQAPSLTEKDAADLAWGLAAGVDYVALSFVRRPEDIRDLRRRIDEAGSAARIVAKIEKPQAVARFDAILAETDAVMVARGDLGVEMDVAEVPLVQKRIIRAAIAAGKPVIVATQMLQSMIAAAQPTRAEVSDVANSILDGTDAVMLSGETAVGAYPARSVAMMDRIADLTEDHAKEFAGRSRGEPHGPSAPGDAGRAEGMTDAGAALADGAVVIARNAGAPAIVVLTHSGATALEVSARRPDVPIIAISDRADTCRQMALYRGVLPIHHRELIAAVDLRARVSQLVLSRNWVEPDAPVVIISGQFPGKPGSSDMLQVCRIKP